MIFNTVLDVVVREVLEEVCNRQEAQHVTGWEEGARNIVFYADDERIVVRHHERVQDALTVTIAMFWRMGIDTNLDKTKEMVCTSKFIWGKWEELDYKIWATGDRETFREQKNTRVSSATCGMTLADSYIKIHMVRSHGICVPQTRGFDGVGGGPTTYVVLFPRVLPEVRCLVLGCPVVAHSTSILCKHFMFCHFRSKVAVLKEGKEPLPYCDFCGMHIPTGRLIWHRKMARWDRNTHMRRRR